MSSNNSLVSRSKRRNAPLSCAECRRLKLRCSRVFPCASCVKKGCAAICPDGHLTTGKGNRFVLANTEALHDKITQLSSRVRQLEDALEQAHGKTSLELHPMLTEELRQIKRPLERESQEELPQSADTEAAEVIDAVGSLSITDSGLTKFYGTTANAWYLLQNEEGDEDAIENPQSILPTSLPWLSYAFPLASLYFKHAAWMYTPIPESEFYGTVLSRFYEIADWSDQDSDYSHKMAILFMVFAMGSLLDLDTAPQSVEAARYYQLGRAALSLDSILEHQTIPAIQALILMCHFMFLSNIDGPRWVVMGLATKLALTLGLHRDGNKWNLDPDEAFRRRSLFYELLTYDSWQSITFGRPPSLSMAFIDCQLPQGVMSKSDGGEPEMSFAAWKHRFAAQCQSVVNEQVFGARLPSHRQLMELDTKIREFYLPPSLRVRGFGGLKYEPPTVPTYEQDLQSYCAFSIREITIFYMHRGFFATALQETPDDPLGHKYAPSVLAAYNSACSYVGLIKSMYSQYPKLVERMWFYLTHVFSCGIVLGAIPSKSPGMKLARSAQAQLDTALGLFDAVQHDPRAAKVLPVLAKLKARAETSMVDFHTRSSAPRSGPSGLSPKDDDELGALQGRTRLVSRKSPAASTPSDSGSQSGSSPRDQPDQSPTVAYAPPVPDFDSSMSTNMPDTRAPRRLWPTQNYGYPSYQSYNDMSHYWQPMHDPNMMQTDTGATAHHSMGQPSMNAGVSPVDSHQQHTYPQYDPVADAYSPGYAHVNGGAPMQPDAWHNLVAQFNNP
ncbi:fungal-specific transcription factor domain-containing protein [Fomitopsis serialis]|uniref:fungal-specific transcription factor domain-containing protein n=1 Tax=Fomitopsis serialis TaxID=139415 RepID=UPI0020073569|nr:fungal-specific transcription factor domain-containing protein [Neoantrodia serialis]KAH9933330.1 fungal-specific transcription factor domain-containing protein [Neoantrodia serialis]